MKTQLQNIKFLVSILILLISTITFAQQGINYQGVARDSNGDLLINTNIALDINIVETSTTGTIVYSETHNIMTDANGVFSTVIGQGTPTLNTFDAINWAEDKHFFNVWLDGTEVGTTEFVSVPYTQAMGKWQAHKNGVTTKGAGGSVYIGENVGMNDNLSDSHHNIGIGDGSLENVTSGFFNNAQGFEALHSNTTGHRNSANGNQALYSNTTGLDNNATGYRSLYSNTTGSNNMASGANALYSNTFGYNNVGLGAFALGSNIGGQNNIAIGSKSLNSNTEGGGNLALGEEALFSNTTSYSNIALGTKALYSNTTGYSNIALGSHTLYSNTTGDHNIANGSLALHDNTTGRENIANGHLSLNSNTTGDYNIATGYAALFRNISGEHNIAQGYSALNMNTIGSNNLALGKQALYSNTTGDYNIATGFETLYNNTSGEHNIASGYLALRSNTIGVKNIAIGNETMTNNTTGFNNIAMGSISQSALVSGNSNISLGSSTLYYNTSGSKNIAIGSAAGQNSQGNYNIFLGTLAGLSETGSYKLYINSNGNPDNFPLIYGEFDNKILAFDAKVGIGTQTPSVPLHIMTGTDVSLALGSGVVVLGNELGTNLAIDSNEIQARNAGVASDLYLQNEGGNVRVGGSIVHASDRRLKRDIEDISFGLKEVMQLEPKEYFWKGKVQDNKSLGLIAQDVDEVIKNVVTYNAEDDKYGVSYTELIPVLIKAIQEQQKIIDSQKGQNEKQNKTITDLESRIQLIETTLLQLK